MQHAFTTRHLNRRQIHKIYKKQENAISHGFKTVGFGTVDYYNVRDVIKD